jgi:CubicO group peptidase (beta-lactamase class C family)
MGYVEKQVFRGANLEEMARRLVTVPLSHQPYEAWRYGQGSTRWRGWWNLVSVATCFEGADFAAAGGGYGVLRAEGSWTGLEELCVEQGRVVEVGRGRRSIAQPTYFRAGRLYSTAGDYMKFLGMLVNGGVGNGKRVLSRSTVDFMFQPCAAGGDSAGRSERAGRAWV